MKGDDNFIIIFSIISLFRNIQLSQFSCIGFKEVHSLSFQANIYLFSVVPTKEDEKKLSFAIIIGISFGGVFIVALITIVLVRHCQKKKLLDKRHHSNVMPSDEAFPDRRKYEVQNGKSVENILYLEAMGPWAKPIEGKENEAYDKL